MKLERKTNNREMKEFDRFEAEPKDVFSIYSIFMKTKLKRVLAPLGLKRKSFQRKLIGKGVEVAYKTNLYDGNYGSWEDKVEVRIMAGKSREDQERAKAVYNAIAQEFNIYEPPIVIYEPQNMLERLLSFGEKMGNHVPGNHRPPMVSY